MAFHKKLSEDGKPHETIIYCDNIQQIYPFTKNEKKDFDGNVSQQIYYKYTERCPLPINQTECKLTNRIKTTFTTF